MVPTVIGVNIVLANLWAAGLAEISMADLEDLCHKLIKISNDFHFYWRDLLPVTTNNPRMFSCIRRNQDYYLIRGSWSDPERYIRDWLGNNRELDPSVREKLIEAALKALSEIEDSFGQIFTQKYVDKNFNIFIPKKHRVKFVQVCTEFAQKILEKEGVRCL